MVQGNSVFPYTQICEHLCIDHYFDWVTCKALFCFFVFVCKVVFYYRHAWGNLQISEIRKVYNATQQQRRNDLRRLRRAKKRSCHNVNSIKATSNNFFRIKTLSCCCEIYAAFLVSYPIPFFYTLILTNHEDKVLKFVYVYTVGLHLFWSTVNHGIFCSLSFRSRNESEGSFAIKDIFSGHFSCLYSNKKSERKLCQFDCIDIS